VLVKSVTRMASFSLRPRAGRCQKKIPPATRITAAATPPQTPLLASHVGTVMVVEPDLACGPLTDAEDTTGAGVAFAAAEVAACRVAEAGAFSAESCSMAAITARLAVSRFRRARSACISAALW
jgi:hypothetical protein